MKNLLIATALALAISFGGSQVAAQAMCLDRGAVVEKLKNDYQEVPRAMGLTGTGLLLELFLAPGGSWTVVVTAPTGVSCFVASGTQFEFIPGVIEGSLS